MDSPIWIGSPPVEVHIRRSARARRYSLRISNADGKVNLTVPTRASVKEAVSFAERQESWLQKHLAKRSPKTIPVFGGTVDFLGKPYVICKGASRQVNIDGGNICAPGNEDQLPAKLRGFCKVQARAVLMSASQNYADKLGVSFGRITLRDTRSRWGSCSHEGNLMFSWRLVLAPAEVIDYVAAHEVSHLLEMNHSDAYWRIVQGICPNYRQHRDWLRKNGHLLHQYGI